MKIKLAILFLCLLPSMVGGQALSPGTSPPVASYRIQSITYTFLPAASILITVKNFTGDQVINVSYPCLPPDASMSCTDDTDAEVVTLIDDFMSRDYTGASDDMVYQVFNKIVADFAIFAGMTVSH